MNEEIPALVMTGVDPISIRSRGGDDHSYYTLEVWSPNSEHLKEIVLNVDVVDNEREMSPNIDNAFNEFIAIGYYSIAKNYLWH